MKSGTQETGAGKNPNLSELRRRLDRDPGSRLFALVVEELRKNGELAEAIRVARDGLAQHPDYTSARISLGQALLESGDAVSAKDEFETVLRRAPDNFVANRLLGECLAAPSAAASPGPSDRAHEAVPGPSVEDSRRPAELQYIDFAEERLVTAAKVAPMLESLREWDSVVGEALRLLGSRVQDLRRDRKISCLAVTSALPRDGKSSVALGLAGALAREEGQRVLLVEADLRRPSLTRTLDLPPAPGLSEWLKGDLENVPLRVLQPGGFSLLTAGETGLERPELLKSPRMDALLRTARNLFNFVILDVVPVLPVTDTLLIQDLVDGFLVVARSRRTLRAAIHEALSQLRPDKIVGVVLNDQHEYRDTYRAYAYDRYGMTDRPRYRRLWGSSGRKRRS